MVFPGEEEEDYTTTATGHDTPNKKKKTLHNFSFTDLKWGAQRNLRCTKIESNVVAVDQRPRRSKLGDNRSHGGAEGIEEEAKGEDHEEEKTSKKEGEREVSPPWNLRKRRAACKAPATDSEGIQKEEEENGVRLKFNPTLTKKEVEDDFIAMTGHKPPRRPKKRPRNVQKQIDVIYLFIFSF
ncbi:hypothetical protein HID58_027385 [Brassica napus]|uniref:Uncharacterized protein n=1 Tax=Brassica napus TaxID=3708 RepID=A0ABQ8CRN8_BRANA|nr:hypothetical protein HID58_027385 [Brassica napus]